MRHSALLAALVVAGCRSAAIEPESANSRYLFVWAGDADRQHSDFLAVIDADPANRSYGSVMTTLPVGAIGTRPHHSEHEMPAGGVLWVNGFDSGRTFRIDLRAPDRPRLAGSFGDAGPYSHPHSYARLPNGNVLATFQRSGGHHATGGLVELDTAGRMVRATSAASAADSGIRPYSLAILPRLDRVVTTATDMHLETRSRAVQIWRLSDLALLQTIMLPPGPSGDAGRMTAEPRVLADGRTVLVNTFTCGLYLLQGLDRETVTAEWIYSTPWEQPPFCALPVVAGNWWIQASNPDHSVVTLDVSDPRRVRVANRMVLAPDEVPHWIALEPNGKRIVITGYGAMLSRLLLARLDRATGAIVVDSQFTTPGATLPGIDFNRETWPHGATGRAIPHGAVFSRP